MIEALNYNTSQLSDWTFKEIIVEKMNEMIVVANAISEIVVRIESEETGFKTKTIGDEEEDEMISHKITEEDLKNNPEFAGEGVKVGDVVKYEKNE